MVILKIFEVTDGIMNSTKSNVFFGQYFKGTPLISNITFSKIGIEVNQI